MASSASEAPVAALEESENSGSRFYFGYWLVGAAFIAQFVSVGSQNYVAGVFLKPMTDDLGWSRGEFTFARTIGQLVMALTGFYVGSYVDRHGGRRVMFIGTTVLVVALFATSYVHSLWQWLILNGLALTAGAAMMGNLVVNVTLSKWFVARRGRMVGLAAMGVSFAGVALPPLMTQVVDEWGWRVAWRVLAIGAGLLVFPIAMLMRRAPEDYGLRPDGLKLAETGANAARAAADFATSLTRRQALRTSSFYFMVFSFALFGVSIGVLLIQTIPFLTDAGYSRSLASWMITITSIPALLVKPVWGIFIDKTEPKRLVALSAAITGTSIVMMVVAVNANADAWVIGSFLLLGIGWGGLIPLQEVTWASYFGRRHLGAVRSAGLPFSIGLGASAPFLVAVYFDQVGDYNGAFLAVAACCLASAVLIMFVRRPERPESIG